MEDMQRFYNFFDLSDGPDHPSPITDVRVKLIGEDGNAFSILEKVKNALKEAGYGDNFVQDFMQQAISGSYEHLLQTVMSYVHVD